MSAIIKYLLVAGVGLNLQPSGYEPDEMSGFLRVFRRVVNVSQINFAQAVVSQMYRQKNFCLHHPCPVGNFNPLAIPTS